MQKQIVLGMVVSSLLLARPLPAAFEADNSSAATPNPTEPVSPSNERILSHIQDELKGNYRNYSINLRIYDGTVTLTGIVDSERDRQDILRRVRYINGVKRVNNQLELRGTHATSITTHRQ